MEGVFREVEIISGKYKGNKGRIVDINKEYYQILIINGTGESLVLFKKEYLNKKFVII